MKYLILKDKYFSNKINYIIKNITEGKINLNLRYLLFISDFLFIFICNFVLHYFFVKKMNNIFLFYNAFFVTNFLFKSIRSFKIEKEFICSCSLELKKYTKNIFICDIIESFILNFVSLILLRVNIINSLFLAIISCTVFISYIPYRKIISIFTVCVFIIGLYLNKYFITTLINISIVVIILDLIVFFLFEKINLELLYYKDYNKVKIRKSFENKTWFNLKLILRNKRELVYQVILFFVFFLTNIVLYIFSKRDDILNSTIKILLDNHFELFVLAVFLLNNVNIIGDFKKADYIMNFYSFYIKRENNILLNRFIIYVLLNLFYVLLLSFEIFVLFNFAIYKCLILIIFSIIFSCYHFFIYCKFKIESFEIVDIITFFVIYCFSFIF